jgi:hypothetical protein
MRRLSGFLLILAVPAGVALTLLATQGGGEPLEPIAPVEALPPPAPVPAEREISLRVRDAEGRSDAGALVVLFAPELAQARADAAGIARLRITAPGPMRLLAWAPGHQVEEFGPWDSPPLDGVSLTPLAEPSLSPAEPLHLATRALILRDQDDAPLAHALVLARPAGAESDPPWVGLTDADGGVELLVAAGPLGIEIYAPGRPPHPAWLLARHALEPSRTDPAPALLNAECTDLLLEGLPAGSAVELQREGRVVDLAVADAEGILRWKRLPPGAWTFTADEGGAREFVLAPGALTLRWDRQ